ncbi:hypothetical protein J486_2526, partial [Acinetobacter baumannii 947299]
MNVARHKNRTIGSFKPRIEKFKYSTQSLLLRDLK